MSALDAVDMNAKAMLPPAWHFLEVGHSGSGTVACFLSKEEIAGPQGKYSAGVSINRQLGTYNAPDVTYGAAAKARAIAGIENIKGDPRFKVISNQVRRYGPSQGHFFLNEIEFVDQQTTPPTHEVFDMIADMQSGSLYLVLAEAQEERWAQDWPILEPIIRTRQLKGL